jgi:hypothetical protein
MRQRRKCLALELNVTVTISFHLIIACCVATTPIGKVYIDEHSINKKCIVQPPLLQQAMHSHDNKNNLHLELLICYKFVIQKLVIDSTCFFLLSTL